jgi:hypothetical protein
MTGGAQPTGPGTGTSRAASFSGTISSPDGSLTGGRVSVPRARSRQIAPAVAAGAAGGATVECVPPAAT